MEAMLKISGSDMQEAAEPMADAIVRILETSAEQETIRKALEVFSATVRVENITIRDCNFTDRGYTFNDEGANN